MAKTTIQAGSLDRAHRDRRFICTNCGETFVADYENYQVADNGELDLGAVAAMSECPICGEWAYSPAGSAGEVAEVTGLVIRSLPVKQIYRPNTDRPDMTGLVIAKVYSDGTVVNAEQSEFTFTPALTNVFSIPLDKREEAKTITAKLTGTNISVKIPILVQRMVIPSIEAVQTEYVYTGSAITLEVKNYDATRCQTPQNNRKTAVGSYTATYLPSLGNCWPDGSTSAISIPWKIVAAT